MPDDREIQKLIKDSLKVVNDNKPITKLQPQQKEDGSKIGEKNAFTEKKCRYCAMMISKEAIICPHCRKKQGTPIGTKILVALFSLVTISLLLGLITNKNGTGSGSIPSAVMEKKDTSSVTSYTSNADEIYKNVTRCMDLQYSLRSQWVPSDTNKSASCLWKATELHGKERVKSIIKLWLKQPYSIKHMTLLTDENVSIIAEARALGLKDAIEENLIDMIIASAAVKLSNTQ